MNNGKRQNRDWSHELAMFESTNRKVRSFNLTPPGVAQVTRVRLRQTFETDVSFRTVGSRLIFEK